MRFFINRQFRLPRVWSNRELKKIATLFTGEVVNISGWKDEDKEGGYYKKYFTNASNYSITNFSGKRGVVGSKGEIFLDLASKLPDNLSRSFDVCFNHTTLEHIYNVETAFSNICEMSRDIVIIVVPFSQEQHETDSFGDFWRFTPTCLRYLFKDNGFNVVYEAESPYGKSGIYLLFAASRRANFWKDKLPNYERIDISGRQLERGIYEKIYSYLKFR
jgi:hypothetical protein